MKKRQVIGLSLGLLLAAAGSANAAQVVGSGGGYFGTADYSNGGGSVVGPYSSWAECNTALQAAIYNNVHNFGYTLVSMHPCSYTPPFAGVMHVDYELQVVASSPIESVGVGKVLLGEVQKIRETHHADTYDAAVGELVRIVDPGKDEDYDMDKRK